MAKPLNDDQLSRLRSEALAPYRGVRRFFYVALGGSAAIGGLIFAMKAIAGRDLAHTIPNLLLQMGICVGLLILWRREKPSP